MYELFLNQIAEKPDEMLPRLIFADWLEEEGDAWGEFIRCQIQAEQPELEDADKDKLERRAMKLLRKYRSRWNWEILSRLSTVEELQGQLTGPYRSIRDWRFRRGMPEILCMQNWVFHAVLPQIRKTLPVRHVWLVDRFSDLRMIVESPDLVGIRELTITFPRPVGRQEAGILKDSANVNHLDRLHIAGSDWGNVSRAVRFIFAEMGNVYRNGQQIRYTSF